MPVIVFVFGNADLPGDSLPLRILPALAARFQDVSFETKDPNEEWDVPKELVVIDAVAGLEAPRVFADLRSFADAPRVSMHDFDAFANLRLLEKIGKLKRVRIIGLPPDMDEDGAVAAAAALLASIGVSTDTKKSPPEPAGK